MARRTFALLLLLASPLTAADPPKLDRHGMPLPPGAIARLGDARLRHASPVTHLSFNADGSRILTVCNDESVHVWDVKTGLPVAQLPPRSAQSAALPPDGKSLVVIDPKGHLKSYDLSDVRKPTRDDRIEGYTGGLAVLAPDGGSFAYLHGARDEEHYHVIRVADWKVMAEIASPRPGLTREVRLSGNGKRVAFIDGKREGDESGVRVHETSGGKLLMATASTDWDFVGLSFDRGGERVAASQVTSQAERNWSRPRRSCATVWDVKSGKPVSTRKPWDSAMGEAYSALTLDGRKLVCCDIDTIRAIDLNTARDEPLWESPRGWLSLVAPSDDGKLLAVVEASYGIRLFDLATGQERTPSGRVFPPGSPRYQLLPGGRLAALDSAELSHVWELTTGRVVGALDTSVVDPRGMVLTTDGYRVVTDEFQSAKVARRIYDLKSNSRGDVEFPPDTQLFSHDSGLLTPDGRQYLLPTEQPPGILVFDMATGRLDRRIAFPRGFYAAIHIPTSTRIAVLQPRQRSDGIVEQLTVWDLDPPKHRLTLTLRTDTGERAYLASLQATPDGRLLFASLREGVTEMRPVSRRFVAVYDLATGQTRATFSLTGADERVIPTPDGRSILTTRGDAHGPVGLWDVTSGEFRGILTNRPRDGPTNQVLVTSDSRFLTVTSFTRLGHVWDLHKPAVDPDALFTGLPTAWDALALRESEKPHAAVAWLAARPAETVPVLADRVKAPESPSPQQVAEWIKQLDAPAFRDREAAERQLRGAIREHAKAMEDAANTTTSPEVRQRLRKLLAAKDRWLPTPEEMRALRAVEVLERIGTPEARAVLMRLAGGPAESWVTSDAAATLERLAAR